MTTVSHPSKGEERSSSLPFVVRAQRHDFTCEVSFLCEGHFVSGSCLNLSESGMLGEFASHLEVWTMGEVLFKTEGCVYTLPVKVARVEGLRAGLVFRPRDEADREAIGVLVKLACAE